MESPVKTPNISDIMSRFARSVKLRSMEFLAELNDFPDGYPNAQKTISENGESPIIERVDAKQGGCRSESLEVLVSNILANISAFKAAYVQLQTAHTPFNVANIQIADKAVISQLQKLSELKNLYRNGLKSPPPDTQLEAQVHERQCMLRTYEMMLNKLESEIQAKDSEVDSIKEEIKRVNQINTRLEQKVQEKSDLCLTIELFVKTVQDCSRETHEFAKIMIGLMKSSGWDLESAASSIHPNIRYAKRSHKKFAFESHVCSVVFGGFESGDFYINGGVPAVLDSEQHRLECFTEFQDLRGKDPCRRLGSSTTTSEITSSDCLFGKFCNKKYLQLVHPRMEKSFFGGLEQRDCVSNGGHPDTPFYQAFLKFAQSVWLVHRLAFSFVAPANIFQVRKGTDFSPAYMESVVKGMDESDDVGRPKVGFTVMPGFRIGKTVIQCQVYLTGMECEA